MGQIDFNSIATEDSYLEAIRTLIDSLSEQTISDQSRNIAFLIELQNAIDSNPQNPFLR